MKNKDFFNINPMLLDEIYNPFNNNNYLYEIKFDGFRSLIYIDKNNIYIKSRNGLILNDIFPELLSIKNISKNTCIFDGEIVLFANNRPSFSKLQQRFRLKNKNKIIMYSQKYPVVFICFDIIYNNKDLTNLPLLKRKKILEKFSNTDNFIKINYFLTNGIELFNFVKEKKLEGIVAKKINSLYKPNTRTKNWIKIKNYKTSYFYIGGYKKEKKDNVIIILLGKKINNKLYFIGKVTLSNKNKNYEKIKSQKKINKTTFIDFDDKEYFFISPKIKIKVFYIEKTKNNNLRHAFIKNEQ